MVKLLTISLILSISFCNPKPPVEPPENPIPDPSGHICIVDKEFCNCYIMIPGSNTWTLIICPEGQVCNLEYQCKAAEPIDPCKDVTCNSGFHCEIGLCIADPIVGKCLAGICPIDKRYINAKEAGNKYVDSTMRCKDKTYCEKATGIPGTFDCALGVEGTEQRIICELEHSPECLRWYYRDTDGQFKRCEVFEHPVASCDHYDRYLEQDGPYKGNCETKEDGFPIAGNETIPHGKTGFRACDTNVQVCSKVLELDR
jgi:hypothetical protein